MKIYFRDINEDNTNFFNEKVPCYAPPFTGEYIPAKASQEPTRPASKKERAKLSELHSEISAAERLRNELKDEKERLKDQNDRLQEKASELERSISTAERKLKELNSSIAVKTSEITAADSLLKQKEKILFGDFSDIVIPDEWLKESIHADAFYLEVDEGFDVFIEITKSVRKFWGGFRIIKERISLFEGIDKAILNSRLEKAGRIAAAINQKIARRATFSPEVAADYGANYDPLADFKRLQK